MQTSEAPASLPSASAGNVPAHINLRDAGASAQFRVGELSGPLQTWAQDAMRVMSGLYQGKATGAGQTGGNFVHTTSGRDASPQVQGGKQAAFCPLCHGRPSLAPSAATGKYAHRLDCALSKLVRAFPAQTASRLPGVGRAQHSSMAAASADETLDSHAD